VGCPAGLFFLIIFKNKLKYIFLFEIKGVTLPYQTTKHLKK